MVFTMIFYCYYSTVPANYSYIYQTKILKISNYYKQKWFDISLERPTLKSRLFQFVFAQPTQMSYRSDLLLSTFLHMHILTENIGSGVRFLNCYEELTDFSAGKRVNFTWPLASSICAVFYNHGSMWGWGGRYCCQVSPWFSSQF